MLPVLSDDATATTTTQLIAADGQPLPKKMKMSTRLYLCSDDEDDDVDTEAEVQTTQSAASMELDHFLKLHIAVSAETDIMVWWRDVGKQLFPNLALVARSVFGLTASSTSSERDFSAAGQTIVPRRSSLDPEHVDQLLVIRGYYKI